MGSGDGKCSGGQIIMGLINRVKTFRLKPEGNGILSRHLSVRVEFQETHSGCTVEEGLEPGKAECRPGNEDVGALYSGRSWGEQARTYRCFIGNSQRSLCPF